MSPDAVAIANDIDAVGESATLRRVAPHGIHFDVELRAAVSNYTIQELTGTIAQGDQQVTISNRQILARQWPGPPRRGDQIIFSDGACQIEGVTTNKIGDEIVSHILQVRG